MKLKKKLKPSELRKGLKALRCKKVRDRKQLDLVEYICEKLESKDKNV